MRTISFHEEAFEEYNSWTVTDRKLFVRLQRLILDAARDPFGGIGKSEPLKGDLAGCWSRRLTEEHRIVYKVTETSILIIKCKHHY